MNAHDYIVVKDIQHFTVQQKANLLTLIKFHGFKLTPVLELMLLSAMRLVDSGYFVFDPDYSAQWKKEPSANKIRIEELMQMMELVNFD